MRASKKFFTDSIIICATIVLVLSLVGTQLAFGHGGILSSRLASATVFNQHWVVLNALKICAEIVFAAVVAWIAGLVSKRLGGVGQFVRQWLLVVIAGLCMTIWLVVKWRTPIYTASYLDAALPIIRDYVPAVAGLLLAIAFAKEINALLDDKRARTILFGALIMPMLAGRDLFGANNGLSIVGTVLIFLTAVAVEKMNTKSRLFWVFMGPILALISMLLMVPISLGLTNSLKMCTQFAGQMSLFILLSGASIASLVAKWVGSADGHEVVANWSVGTVMVGLLVALNNNFFLEITDLAGLVKAAIGQRLGVWMIVVAVIAAAGIGLAVLLILLLLQPTWIAQKLVGKVGHESITQLLSRFACGEGKSIVSPVLRQYLPGIGAFASLWIAQNISTLLMNEKMTTVEHLILSNQNIFEYTIVKRAATMLFGTIILYAFFSVLRALTNKFWTSILITQFIALGWAVASRIKIASRSEPITIGDMYEIRAISELLGMISPWVIVGTVTALVLLVAAIIYLERKHRVGSVGMYNRILMVVLASAFLAGFRNINHDGSYGRNLATSFRNSPSIINQMLCAQNNGPVLQFINGMDVEVMPKPTGYSKASVSRIVKKYDGVAKQINATRTNNIKDTTVIFNLSESFSDPTRMPHLAVNKDPLPNIRKLKKTNTSGLMMSYGYGGGTANIEWESLTGTSLGNLDTGLSTPYTQMVTKLKQAPSINQYFDYSAGIHPYLGTFYGRSDAYVKFKFNKFEYLGSKYKIKHQKKLGNSNYLSDYTAYANTMDQLRERKSGQFINLVTMQNHMPFAAGTYDKNDFKVSGKAYGNANGKAPLESYIQGLNYTDNEVAKFRAAIDKINRPIIWVWYGDHLAGLFSGDNIPQNTVVMHMTDYFVYANKYAREHGATTKISDNTNVIGANNFGALAFEQANAKVDAYMALMTKVQQKLPTIWSKTDNSTTNSTMGMRFVQANGTRADYSKLTKSQKELLHEYQLIQYDIDAGNQYSIKDDMFDLK